jgi:hypothetical protein
VKFIREFNADRAEEARAPPSAHEEAARVAVIEECAKVAEDLATELKSNGIKPDYHTAWCLPASDGASQAAERIRALAIPKDAGGAGNDSSLPQTAGPQVPIAPKADSHTPDLVAALSEIANHWACDYDHKHANTEAYRGPYGIGIVDGHRAAAIIARAALSKLEGK